MTDTSINQVCLRHTDQDQSWTLGVYEKNGGYKVWRKILNEQTDPQQIIDEIKQSNLRGRGGAGFATGLKWSFVDRNNPKQKFLVCNSDEGEPGTCKDTLILSLNPHQLLEGIAICSYVMGATKAYNYLRGEFDIQFKRCEQALKEATEAGLLGKNCLGSGVDIEIFNILGAGSYIVGEETAMLESLEASEPCHATSRHFLPCQVYTACQLQLTILKPCICASDPRKRRRVVLQNWNGSFWWDKNILCKWACNQARCV